MPSCVGRRLVLLLALVGTGWGGTLSGFAVSVLPEPDTFQAKVIAVADGDTITVLRDKAQVKVRLEGIDCPERKQAFGTKAREYTADKAFGKTVTIRGKDKDRYGRLLAEVVLPDGQVLNKLLVRDGLAWHYKKYSKDEELARLEKEAREAKRGLWQDKEPVLPWEFRRPQRAP